MAASRSLRRARFARAGWWLALGVAIVPLKPGSKHLQPGFGPRQACITDQDWARRWFLNTDANLGVVLGGSAGLVVADWDDAAAYRAWRATRGATVHTLTERTARGYHVFFFGAALPSAADSACEFKTSGACLVAPSIHPSGARYRVVHPAPIATLDGSTARSLFPFLSAATDPQRPDTATSPSRTPAPTGLPARGAQAGLIARIKAARPLLDELRHAGIELRPAGRNTLIGRCPFHDDHTPSLWVYADSGLWGCNRPDCPAAGTHDVINFRARWPCGIGPCRLLSAVRRIPQGWRSISNRAAIRQLADEFL